MKVLQILSDETLRARAMRGSAFTTIGFASSNVIRLIGNLVLTRILFPEAFGVMALVQVVLTGLNMLSNVGIRASIIQDDRGTEQVFLNTAWAIQILRGTILWGIIWVVAGPIAAFYEEPLLKEILPVAGSVAFFQGFNSTKMSTANRNLTIGRMTVLGIAAQVVGLGIMIVLALSMQSVWALVYGSLVGPFLIAVLSHFVLPGTRNRIAFERASAVRLFSFGKYLFFATMAGFLIAQADRAILGKTVSLSDLAFYNIAYFLASVPLLLMRKFSDVVLFPLYRNRPPAESETNRTKVAWARLLLSGSMLAVSFFLALVGDTFIRSLYDARYHAAGPLLVLLALAHMPIIVTSHYGAALLASGEAKRFAILMTVIACLKLVLLVFAAIWFGLIGVIIVTALYSLLLYPFTVKMIYPLGVWTPRSDMALYAVTALCIAIVLGLYPDTIATVWHTFASQ